MNNSINKILILIFSFFLLNACNDPGNEKSDLDFVRFDRLLMGLDTSDIQQAYERLEAQYPEFTTIYFSEVLPVPGYTEKNDTFFSVATTHVKVATELAGGLPSQEAKRDLILADLEEINSRLNEAVEQEADVKVAALEAVAQMVEAVKGNIEETLETAVDQLPEEAQDALRQLQQELEDLQLRSPRRLPRSRPAARRSPQAESPSSTKETVGWTSSASSAA